MQEECLKQGRVVVCDTNERIVVMHKLGHSLDGFNGNSHASNLIAMIGSDVGRRGIISFMM